MVSKANSKPIPIESEQKQAAQFATFNIYMAEVKRLLLEKSLRPEWVDELITGDEKYLERAFSAKKLPVYAAFEVYMTEEESTREHVAVAEDFRLKLSVTDQAKTYLLQLVKIGLWGDTVEDVAATLIQQQLASKLEAGLFKPLFQK